MDSTEHRSEAEMAGLDAALAASPKDQGVVRAIVARPENGARRLLSEARLSLTGGVEGDHWAKGCWKSLEDGAPDPDVQICIMNARAIAFVARSEAPEAWAPAGDNIFLDMDLSEANLPVGQRLSVGTVELEITAEPHLGCRSFSARYGRDALRAINDPARRVERLRGVYARVVQDGVIGVGDTVAKL